MQVKGLTTGIELYTNKLLELTQKDIELRYSEELDTLFAKMKAEMLARATTRLAGLSIHLQKTNPGLAGEHQIIVTLKDEEEK